MYMTCSPPMRGWAQAGHAPVGLHGVLPAHAGVSPVSSSIHQRHPCAPRPCGGEPDRELAIMTALQCSPPMRG